MKAKKTTQHRTDSLGARGGETKTRDELRDELDQITHKGWPRNKQDNQRADLIIRVLAEGVCRNCGRLFHTHKTRADYTGYCTARCLHEKAKQLGYRKGGKDSEYDVLSWRGEVGTIHAYDPKPPVPMADRIVKALQTTFNYIAGDDHGFPDEDLYAMAGDCYLELHGGDDEAARAFYAMPHDEQEKLMKKAFPSYVTEEN
jgi:hypothetical protein